MSGSRGLRSSPWPAIALSVPLSAFGVAAYALASTGVGEKNAGPSEVVAFANVLADGTLGVRGVCPEIALGFGPRRWVTGDVRPARRGAGDQAAPTC
jgi:hypothetical protein